jgi:hypothetical protein
VGRAPRRLDDDRDLATLWQRGHYHGRRTGRARGHGPGHGPVRRALRRPPPEPGGECVSVFIRRTVFGSLDPALHPSGIIRAEYQVFRQWTYAP